ncbi:hypothetical protein [Brevundimonas sp.]|uniref:hypothetical protein n=1 Tax=Brevundimonas sp. TaxID=1871086 RepID=UPI002D4D1120|nr:hypothetical protein [Brevundimonas sp.]HYD26963.1 hypothetical protein [Brevundimonas sp.]
MPQAMVAAVAAVGNWVAHATATVLINAGVGINTAFAIAHVAGAVVEGLVYTGLQAGAAALMAPEVPKSEAGKTALLQPMPARQYVLGQARVSGPYMLWESKKRLYDVIAFADQELDSIGKLWLHDDEVTVDANNKVNRLPTGAYGGHGVWIFTRLGLPTETSYTVESTLGGSGEVPVGPTPFSELGADVWTEDHRLDGIASGCLICAPVEQDRFHRVFPNGYPVLQVEAKAKHYDWRPEGVDEQDPDDDATHLPSLNPIVLLANYLTTPTETETRGDRFDRLILPQIQSWTTAADDCDDEIPLKAGGSEPRYRAVGVFYYASTHPVEVIARLLEACDGWMAESGDGSWTVQAGVFREPTFTLVGKAEGGHIREIVHNTGRPSEQAVNELAFSYNSLDHAYSMAPGDPWRDEADIAELGAVMTQSLPLGAVPSHGQGRRLCKRRMHRMTAPGWGRCRTDLVGFNILGERLIKIAVEDGEWDALQDITVEVVGSPRIDFKNLAVEFDYVVIDIAAANAWDPETEEGEAPLSDDDLGDTDPDSIDTPTIGGVAEDGVQLEITLTGLETGANVATRWRELGMENWLTASPNEPVNLGGGIWTINTSTVTQGATLEVAIAAVIDGFYSDWTEPFEFTTTGGA